MYKYLFGPVPSRRLGISLGVDLVPKKVCSLDCVYCEVGKTTKLTTERKEYILYDNVIKELESYFETNPDPDYITFSGAGEPTLNSRLGDVLKFIKKTKPNIPVAVLTNGTLLYQKEVREELMPADLILPSLDAITESVFQKINRPNNNLSAKKIIQGLLDFSKVYQGKIWLEIFILPDYNYLDEEILEMKSIIEKINPDSVQINTLDRPGTLQDLHPSTKAELKRVVNLLDFENTIIIASAPKRKNIQSYRSDVESAILGTISRRPCTVQDMVKFLGLHINEINKYLDVLEAENKIEVVEEARGFFYQKRD